MNEGTQYVHDQAIQAAARRLQQATVFTNLNIKQPVFQKLMGKGANAVLVRFAFPGVLSVYDPATGALLGVSEPGKPDVLSDSFVPSLPTTNGKA